jgi:DNA-directed RNA polymerase subunit RPC12/RpoP
MSGQEQAAPAAAPRRFPCGQCGADLEFRPGAESLACPYCGARTEIEADEAPVVEHDYREQLERLAAAEPVEEPDEMECRACGAMVHRPPNLDALACPFCGYNLVALEVSRRLIKPQYLLPFAVSREQAWTGFRAWMRRRWFAPTKLKRFARSEGLFRGVYVPYWTYDSATTSHYSGMRGDHYYVTVGHGDKKRRERRTRWTPASGVVSNRFDDLLVLASRSQPVQEVERLAPWDLDQLVPTAEDYLAGFLAESYEIDLPGGFEIARGVMDAAIRGTVAADIGGDTQQIHEVRTSFDELTFKHILLPVWVGGYRFRNRMFAVVVNGRTGEVQGQRPWSWIKITAAVLAGVAAIAIIALIVRIAG